MTRPDHTAAGGMASLGSSRVVQIIPLAISLGLAVPAANTTVAAAPDLHLPREITTHPDGRMPLRELHAAYLGLVDRGWLLDVVAYSNPGGTAAELPIIALRSPLPGAAVWILSGIHGEEPAGPNAIALATETLASLAERLPVVLIPLCNPHGYARNWRYLNMPTYSESVEGESVGDSSHLLPDFEHPGRPRAENPSSPEADALTRYLLQLAETYRPRYSVDLHEDNLIPEGYVYSQGELGADDPLAAQAVALLRAHGIPIKVEGRTRFGEEIAGGIIGPVTDSSIDELIGAREIMVDGRRRPGPSARTVLVFETPAEQIPLARRVDAHLALILRLAALIATGPGGAQR